MHGLGCPRTLCVGGSLVGQLELKGVHAKGVLGSL